VPEALQAVARLAGPGELVVLLREAHVQHLPPQLSERDEELVG